MARFSTFTQDFTKYNEPMNQFQLSPAMLGLVRSLGFVVILAVVSFLANAANLHGVVSDGLAASIATLALVAEHYLEGKTGSALFGAARKSL